MDEYVVLVALPAPASLGPKSRFLILIPMNKLLTLILSIVTYCTMFRLPDQAYRFPIDVLLYFTGN